MTTLSYRAMAFGPELRVICHYLNIYAPVFQPGIMETRGADDYWQVETFILGSMENEERVITESFEVHAQKKEWCVRMAAHIALGRIVETYSARLKGTVYAEMAKVLPSGNIIPKRFRYVPGAIWLGTPSNIIQSLEKCTQSDLYTITKLQQKNTRLKRDNNKLKQERLEMQVEITRLKEKMKANGIEEPAEEPEVDTSAEEEEPNPKRRNRISGREYRMLFSKDNIRNYYTSN